MKLLRTTALSSLLIFALIFNWNCSDENAVSTTENSQSDASINNGIELDGPTSQVQVYIEEYVQLSTNEGSSFTETRIQIEGFTDCLCFPVSHMEHSSFYTPPTGWRDIGGGQWIRSLSPPKYKIVYNAAWNCVTASTNTVALWEVSGGLSSSVPLNGTCVSDGSKKSGSYSNSTADITTWSNNELHYVDWGTDVIVGCCDDDDSKNTSGIIHED
jgi:hypothetical protein